MRFFFAAVFSFVRDQIETDVTCVTHAEKALLGNGINALQREGRIFFALFGIKIIQEAFPLRIFRRTWIARKIGRRCRRAVAARLIRRRRRSRTVDSRHGRFVNNFAIKQYLNINDSIIKKKLETQPAAFAPKFRLTHV